MPLTRAQKEQEVANLQQAVENAGAVSFVTFHGLTVDEVQQMRGTLRENGVDYKVVKKTLAKIALDNAGIGGEQPPLDGELAIAYGEDTLEPARSIYQFQKQFEDRVAIIGGIFEGEYRSRDEMIEIASIPPVETLRGKFVNVINSPIQGFVGVLDQIAKTQEANA